MCYIYLCSESPLNGTDLSFKYEAVKIEYQALPKCIIHLES